MLVSGGQARLQINSSSSTPITAISSGTRIMSRRQASKTYRACASFAAISPVGSGELRQRVGQPLLKPLPTMGRIVSHRVHVTTAAVPFEMLNKGVAPLAVPRINSPTGSPAEGQSSSDLSVSRCSAASRAICSLFVPTVEIFQVPWTIGTDATDADHREIEPCEMFGNPRVVEISDHPVEVATSKIGIFAWGSSSRKTVQRPPLPHESRNALEHLAVEPFVQTHDQCNMSQSRATRRISTCFLIPAPMNACARVAAAGMAACGPVGGNRRSMAAPASINAR